MLCITFMRRYLIRWLGGLLCAVVGLIAAAWAFGAVWFDGPFGAGNKPGGCSAHDRIGGRAHIR